MAKLWVEAYRPTDRNSYVWKDEALRSKVDEWIAAKEMPHVLFAGGPGVGKTSLALMVLKEMGIPSGDILKIDASRDRKIDDIEAKIRNFVSTWALGDTGIKYCIFDEADSLSQTAQRMLRNDLETYASTTRFIFTANFPERIIPPIHSRLQTFTFTTLDRDGFIVRIGEILTSENVQFDVDHLMEVTDLCFPDLRKAINLAQQSVVDGVLQKPAKETVEVAKDYLIEVAAMFKAGRTLDARKLLIASASQEEYTDIFRWAYKNLDIWGDTEEQKEEALLAIRKGLVYDGQVADRELSLAATMVELTQIWRKTQN